MKQLLLLLGLASNMQAVDLDYKQGWNLVSPIISQSTATSEYAKNLPNLRKIWGYKAGEGWKKYNADGTGDLTQLDPMGGYWFLMDGNTLDSKIACSNSDQSYSAGWNLVGFNDNFNLADLDAFTKDSSVSKIWTYSPTIGWEKNPTEGKAGRGYWVLTDGPFSVENKTDLSDVYPPTCPGCPTFK